MLKLVCLATALLFAVPAFAAPDTASAPAKPAPATRGVMRFDANHDGTVDRDEWNAGQEARFKQLDTNDDGKLSQEELFARSSAARGNAASADRQAQRQAAYFRRLDRDNDGFVSKAEFMAQANQNFARCDLNKDNHIDTAECRQALRRRPSQPVSTDR